MNFNYTLKAPEGNEEVEKNENTNKNATNNNQEINETEKQKLDVLDNMEISIKRRNSIDIADEEGHNSSFIKEF